MTSFRFVYLTVGNTEEAKKIAHTVVKKKLAACATLIPQALSVYEWENKIQESAETIIFMKTTTQHFIALEKEIKRLHSYECPCIVSLAIEDGSSDFLQWVNQQINTEKMP